MLDNLKSVTKDSFFYSIANLMNKVVGLILLPIYSRYFLISEYGLLALFDTILDFIGMFSSFGIVEAFKRWYWEDDNRKKQNTVFTTVFIFSIVTAIVFSLILYVILRHFSTFIFGVEISQSLINIYIISIIANIIMQRIFILLRTRRQAKKNMIFHILRAVTTCLATVIFIVHYDLGMQSIFLARIIGIVITLLFLIPEILRNISWNIDYKLLGKMLKFSYPLAISSSLSLVFTFSDRWLLKGMTSLDDVGQYSLAYRITNLLRFLVINSFLQAYVYTFFQKMHNPEHYNFFKKIITYFTLSIMVIGLILVTYSRELIMMLADDQAYIASYSIIPILMIAIMFSGLRQILVLPFYKYKHTKYISAVSIAAGVVNIILNILLIPIWKSYGAATGTAIAHIVVVITLYIKGRKFSEFSYEINRFFMILVSGTIYILLLIALNRLPIITGIIGKSLLLLSYPVLLYMMGFFAKKEIENLKQLIKNPLRKKTL